VTPEADGTGQEIIYNNGLGSFVNPRTLANVIGPRVNLGFFSKKKHEAPRIAVVLRFCKHGQAERIAAQPSWRKRSTG
jgi:hypothetical protein